MYSYSVLGVGPNCIQIIERDANSIRQIVEGNPVGAYWTFSYWCKDRAQRAVIRDHIRAVCRASQGVTK